MKKPDRLNFNEANGHRATIRLHSNGRNVVFMRFLHDGTERVDLSPETVDDIIVWLMYYKKYLEEQSG